MTDATKTGRGRVEVGEPLCEADGPRPPGRGIARREFLQALAAAGAGGALAAVLGEVRPAGAVTGPVFPDGVICGDPQPDGAVIWTRITPQSGAPLVPVLWLVAEDAEMTRVVRGGLRSARAVDGHTVKVHVGGLRPDRWYHYRFQALGALSAVGRLRTAPLPTQWPDRLRYAFASCQQRTDSFYVAHRAIANENVDFLMHLGDYIYVSDSGTITLNDYRQSWRTFHSNPLLQEMQAAVPLVAMWDDGEFYNGVDRTGPPARLAAAKQAWFEHNPVVRGPEDRVHRSFPWGRLADVFMIDVRSYRDPEVPSNTSGLVSILDGQDSSKPGGAAMFDPSRTTLGAAQKRWLETGLLRSRSRWRFIGNPYNFNPWKLRDAPQDPNVLGNEGTYVSNEAWDDYQAERRELLEFLARQRVRNVVFTSGHTHMYMASDLQPDFDDPTSPVVAFDFVTGSLTADPDPRIYAPENVLRLIEATFLQQNAPYMKGMNIVDQGYAVVDATPEEVIVEFRVLDTFDPDATPVTAARYRVVNEATEIEVL